MATSNTKNTKLLGSIHLRRRQNCWLEEISGRGGGNPIIVGRFKITSNSERFFFLRKRRNQYSNIKMQINGEIAEA